MHRHVRYFPLLTASLRRSPIILPGPGHCPTDFANSGTICPITAIFCGDSSSKMRNVWETEHLKITEHFHNLASYLGKIAVTAHSGITESEVLTISVSYFLTPAKGSGTLSAGLSDPAEAESRNSALLIQWWRRSCTALWRTSSVQQHTYHLTEFLSEQMTKKKNLIVLLSFYFGSVFSFCYCQCVCVCSALLYVNCLVGLCSTCV